MSFIYRCELCGTEHRHADAYDLDMDVVKCQNCGQSGCDLCILGGSCEECLDAEYETEDEDDLPDWDEGWDDEDDWEDDDRD